MAEINQTVPTQDLHLSLWQMEHRIKNLHANTVELHEKTTELHTKTTELHERVDENYATKEYVDDKFDNINNNGNSGSDLTGLISREENATSSILGSYDLDIITLGDNKTGEIRFGPEINTDAEFGIPKTLNSVITKRYIDDFMIKNNETHFIEIGNGFEFPGLKFANVELDPMTTQDKLTINMRLTAGSTQTSASDNDYVTKSEVDDTVSDTISDALTGLISKEEDATKAVNGTKDLDIITLGDSNTGEIRFGPESNNGENYGIPKTNNSVITKRYIDNLIFIDKQDYLVEIGYGYEIPGIKFGGIQMNPGTTWGKLTINKRLTAGSAQTNASANDYLTKSEVQTLIPDTSQFATKQFVLDTIANAIANL
jgi:hypothetical protein